METKTDLPDTPGAPALALAPCSAPPVEHPRYIVTLRGGTILRLPGGVRSAACEYDKLLSLLDACEVWQRPSDWDAPAEGWTTGKRGIVGAAMEHSTLVSDILPNVKDEPRPL